jgi:hypothetical protein
LGDHLGELEEFRETTKGVRYLDFIKQGFSSTAADNQSRAEVAEVTGQVKRLKLMHSDASGQVSMIQSRLRVLEAERRGDL